MITAMILIVDVRLMHLGVPVDTGPNLVYDDIIYPKAILEEYILAEYEIPDMNIHLPEWEYVSATNTVQLRPVG